MVPPSCTFGVPGYADALLRRKLYFYQSPDTHPREGGGFRALIRAGWRHRADGGKGRVKGRPQEGDTENGARSKGSVPQCTIRGFWGTRGRNPTPQGPGGQQFSWGRSEPLGSREAERGSMSGILHIRSWNPCVLVLHFACHSPVGKKTQMRTTKRQAPSTTTPTLLAMGGGALEGVPCLWFSC